MAPSAGAPSIGGFFMPMLGTSVVTSITSGGGAGGHRAGGGSMQHEQHRQQQHAATHGSFASVAPSAGAASGGASEGGGGGDVCIGGGPHDFQHVSAENEKKSLFGGFKAMFMGTGGGATAENSSDTGQRVILYCKKCGKDKIISTQVSHSVLI